MKKAEYVEILKETLELNEDIDETTCLADIFNWDSMAQIMVIAKTQVVLGHQLQVADLMKCKKIGDIVALLGEKLE